MLKLEEIEQPISKKIQTYTEDEALEKVQEHAENAFESDHPQTTTYCGVPIRFEHSLKTKARSIIRHNIFNEVTRITTCGKTGSGKTTIDVNLLHEIHTIAESEFEMNYNIVHVSSKELKDFDNYIKHLAPVDHCIVFEDVTYDTEIMSKIDKLTIKKSLTEARRKVGGVGVQVHLIFIFNIHYTKSLDKMMRDADFKIFTSISDEEKPNLLGLLGWDNQGIIEKFEYRHRGMLTNGWWSVKLDEHDNRMYIYHTNRPFRLALFSELGILHFVVYASFKSLGFAVACNHCIDRENRPLGQKISARAFYDGFVKKYTKSRANSILRNFLFMKGFKEALDSNMVRGHIQANQFTKNNYVELEELVKIVVENKIHGRTRVYVKEEDTQRLFRDIKNHHYNNKTNKEIDPNVTNAMMMFDE